MTNRKAMKVLERTKTPHGYVIHRELWEPIKFYATIFEGGADDDDGSLDDLVSALESASSEPTEMVTTYTNEGGWIGSEKEAKMLCVKLGIAPEHITPVEPFTILPCSVGFCEKEQKWYGWSHRAIYGFGVGDAVKIGDCAYKPPNKQAFNRKYLDFFTCDERHDDRKVISSVNSDGECGALITATYNDKTLNKKLRGKTYEMFWPYSREKFGRGEWVAETLSDAREMAVDFANGVS